MRAHLINAKINWRFARECDRAATLDDVGDLLMVEAARLGFRFFALCSQRYQRRSSRDPIVIHNYPSEWQERYKVRNYAERDPVLLRARRQALPFLWCDPAFLATLAADQRNILTEAASHGLRHGVTIPLHRPWRGFGSCSFVSESAPIDEARIPEAIAIAAYAFDAAWRIAHAARHRGAIRLTQRERQCLELVALGKTDEEIAEMLKVDASTARAHVDSAKQRLGALKRPQAVAYAIYFDAIDLDELFDR